MIFHYLSLGKIPSMENHANENVRLVQKILFLKNHWKNSQLEKALPFLVLVYDFQIPHRLKTTEEYFQTWGWDIVSPPQVTLKGRQVEAIKLSVWLNWFRNLVGGAVAVRTTRVECSTYNCIRSPNLRLWDQSLVALPDSPRGMTF